MEILTPDELKEKYGENKLQEKIDLRSFICAYCGYGTHNVRMR